jgi:Kef-type K+ transport system membrane component KefB/mannitol/fructose-specific phosphotransferase system IIA component (Ntr-type)/nucleotide-binding universal stress UspA family protein
MLQLPGLPITDPVLIFAVVMLILLVAPMAAGRFRLPGLIGIIAAGALIGPSVLGILERDRTMILLGTVGLLYLMFTAGVSIDLAQFFRLKFRSATFGGLSFGIPQAAGVSAALFILGFDLPAALLLGSIVGSHTLLAYPVAKRLGLAKSPAITTAMGGTIVTDAASLLVLAVVVGSTQGGIGPTFWVKFLGLLSIFVAAVVIGLPRLARWFFQNVRNQPTTEYVFLMAALFTTAYVAHLVGLAPIVGAFLAGLTLNRLVPDGSALMSRVQFVGDALLVPFFLLSVGMLVDFGVLFTSFAVWGYAIVFTALVVFGKTLAAKISQILFRQTSDEGWTVAGLTMPQAAATLAVTLVAFDLDLFSREAVNAVVVMILVTCFLGPWMVEKFGRRMATAAEREMAVATAPQRLMVPLANPTTAEPLLDLSVLLRDKGSEEPVYPLTVARDGPHVQAELSYGEKMLSHAVIHGAAADVPVQPVTRVDMNIAAGILRARKELRATTTVIGWSGKVGTRERIFGSVLDQLLDDRAMNLLVCRLPDTLNTTENVVLLLPPLAEHEASFPGAMHMTHTLVNQLGAKMKVVLPKAAEVRVKRKLARVKPTVTPKMVPVDWARMMGDLSEHVGEHDLILLYGAREGGLAWTSVLDRMPRTLAAKFEKQNLVILYPAEPAEEQTGFTPMPRKKAELPSVLEPELITFGLEEMSPRQVLDEMLTGAYPDKKRMTDPLVKSMLSSADEFSHEIHPGVVLLYESSPAVDGPAVVLGISKGGLAFPKIERPVHLVFAVVLPEADASQHHLDTLAAISRMLPSQEAVTRMKDATNVDELQVALAKSGVAPAA